MANFKRLLILTTALSITSICCVASLFSLPWPVAPGNSTHPVNYFYGGWQGMWRAELSENKNYFHNAMDIPGLELESVYSVESGYVKSILTIFDSDAHWRIIIADSSGSEQCDGWLYAHVDKFSIPFSVGDFVNEGDFIGSMVAWPNPNTPIHLHFARVKFAGDSTAWAEGFWDYEYTANPISFLGLTGDTISPVLENAFGTDLFAICDDQTDNYFSVGEEISGKVDIVCSPYDFCGDIEYRTIPYLIEYKIEGDSSLPWMIAFEFSGSIDSYNGDMEALSKTVYKYDATCNTTYSDSVVMYAILTNSDGDGIMEISDTSGCWETSYFHNGEYWIFARLSDYDGNQYLDSMSITVGNYHDLSCLVTLGDGNTYLAGTSVSVAPPVISETCNASGEVTLSEVGGGEQLITISRPGYTTVDTVLLMTNDSTLIVILQPDIYICGDIDMTGVTDIADLTYFVDWLFRGGPPPPLFIATDVDASSSIDVADLTYIVDWMFKSGSDPICETDLK